MAICKLTIRTIADGTENKIVRMGKIEEDDKGVTLRYREENAEVFLRVFGKRAQVQREGDYSLLLPLAEGEKSVGALGLGGTEGEVEITTERVECTQGKEETKIALRYVLLFNGDPQKMQLEITAMKRCKQ